MGDYSLKVPEQTSYNTEPKADKAPTSVPKPDNNESPEDSGSPLGVEHFGVKEWSQLLLTPTLDFNKTVEKIGAIEDFIKEQMTLDGIKVDKEGYSKIVKELEEELSLTSAHKPEVRINKIFNLIKMIQRTHSEKERKNTILSLINSKK